VWVLPTFMVLAIKEMTEKGIDLTVYKVHQNTGFGEVKHEDIRKMIESIISIKTL
jgi:hypothetical protein